MKAWSWCWLLLGLVACTTPRDDLAGLADQPPLDLAVLVTGGAYLSDLAEGAGAFGGLPRADATADAPEALPIADVLDVLRRGRVFQRVELDDDPVRRRRTCTQLRGRGSDAATAAFLQDARARGFDLLLVVEELQDGPIDRQGTNGRWPVTFATWVLLGVGAFIPDRTFESRASLRVSLRELQAGNALADPLLVAGPIDLALTERTDWLGLVTSIVVPPFWVGDDTVAVRDSVRTTTQRRLLLSLARDLKAGLRQRLRERAAANLTLLVDGGAPRVVVEAGEALGTAAMRAAGVVAADAEGFAERLLASRTRDGARFRYEAALPVVAPGERVQVLVGTLSGAVASATFVPGAAP